MMKENLIGGTEAIQLLGLPAKKGKQTEQLRPYGLRPVFSKQIGRGITSLYIREDVEKAAEKLAADRPKSVAKKTFSGSRFMPTVESMALLSRIESKLDQLLAMWDSGKP